MNLKWLFRWKPKYKYTFEHENGTQKFIYASSKEKAWRKMRRFIHDQMYGPWALMYFPEAVDHVMDEIKLKKIEVIRE